MIYQAYNSKWLFKILANGYLLILLTLLSFVSMHLNLPDFITIIPFPFILLSGAYGSSGIDNFFSSKFLQKLGDWSFSIYLVHQPLLFTIGAIIAYLNPMDPNNPDTGLPPKPDLLTGWLICFAFILLTLFISFITYKFIEVPARNRLNRKHKYA
jgi:peptidoglycan/LPS O-acetylase OafA/YrhL